MIGTCSAATAEGIIWGRWVKRRYAKKPYHYSGGGETSTCAKKKMGETLDVDTKSLT